MGRTMTAVQLEEVNGGSVRTADEGKHRPSMRDEEIAHIASFRIRECARRLQELAELSMSPSLRRELKSLSVELASMQRRLV